MFTAMMHRFRMLGIIRVRRRACGVCDSACACAICIGRTRGMFNGAEAEHHTLKERCAKETHGKHQVAQFAEKCQRSLMCKQRHYTEW